MCRWSVMSDLIEIWRVIAMFLGELALDNRDETERLFSERS